MYQEQLEEIKGFTQAAGTVRNHFTSLGFRDPICKLAMLIDTYLVSL